MSKQQTTVNNFIQFLEVREIMYISNYKFSSSPVVVVFKYFLIKGHSINDKHIGVF